MKHTLGDEPAPGDPVRSDSASPPTAADLDVSLSRAIRSRAEFELALPLYVGGDLDAAERARVETWLEQHPEDAAGSSSALARAHAAHAMLVDHAAAVHGMNTPELWTGIRDELARSGAISGGAKSSARRMVLESGPEGRARRGLGTPPVVPALASGTAAATPAGPLAPILGGARWFQRKSVAAAAAVLLTGSVAGFFAVFGGDPSPSSMPTGLALQGAPSQASGVPGRSHVSDAPHTGLVGTGAMPASVELAGSPGKMRAGAVPGVAVRGVAGPGVMGPGVPTGRQEGRGVPLHRPGQGAEHLIDEADAVRLWQVEGWHQLQSAPDAQLTGTPR